jgi:hypothetical protein
MGRTVVTKREIERELQNAREGAKAPANAEAAADSAAPAVGPDDYKDRLLKYIPAEIVAIYLALLSVLKAAPPEKTPIVTVEWFVFWIILFVTVPWQRRILKITKWQQIVIGTVAFVFWAISLGDPFTTSWKEWYQPLYGTMAMMLYTFLIPLFEPAPSQP